MFGVGKPRKLAFPEREFQIAALRDLDGVPERFGDILEKLRHLRLRFEVLLAAEVLGPALVGQDVAFGDAHARFVRPEIVRLHELDRVRRHRRQFEIGSETDRALHVQLDRHRRRAARHRSGAEPLQLDVVPVRKDPLPLGRKRVRKPRVVDEERLPDVAQMRPGERDQAFRADLGEPRLAQLRPAAMAVRSMGEREQLAQIQIAGVRLAEQQQPMGLVAVGLVRDPHIAAGNRLHAPRACLRVELDETEGIREIRERERRHAVRDGGVDRFVEAHDAVHDGVFAVQPEVNEGRIAHAIYFT